MNLPAQAAVSHICMYVVHVREFVRTKVREGHVSS